MLLTCRLSEIKGEQFHHTWPLLRKERKADSAEMPLDQRRGGRRHDQNRAKVKKRERTECSCFEFFKISLSFLPEEIFLTPRLDHEVCHYKCRHGMTHVDVTLHCQGSGSPGLLNPGWTPIPRWLPPCWKAMPLESLAMPGDGQGHLVLQRPGEVPCWLPNELVHPAGSPSCLARLTHTEARQEGYLAFAVEFQDAVDNSCCFVATTLTFPDS